MYKQNKMTLINFYMRRKDENKKEQKEKIICYHVCFIASQLNLDSTYKNN